MTFDLIEDILPNTFVCHGEMINEVIFVDTNPATIKIEKIHKVDSKINKSVEVKNWNLEKIKGELNEDRIYISQNYIAGLIDKEFIEYLISSSKNEVLRCKKSKFFGLFTTLNYKKILKKLADWDWVILNTSHKKTIEKSSGFSENQNETGLIKRIGKLKGTTIFCSDHIDSDSIIVGKLGSMTAIFLKEISIKKETNIYEIEVDYLFESQHTTKLVLV